jgi:hypothetical protein
MTPSDDDHSLLGSMPASRGVLSGNARYKMTLFPENQVTRRLPDALLGLLEEKAGVLMHE